MGIVRLLLAAVVALSHAGFVSLSLAGFSIELDAARAVQGFFVISGFYMAMILEGPYRNDVLRFYVNRALRIFPAYWIVAAVTLTYMLVTGADWKAAHAFKWQTFEPLTVLANVIIFGQDFALMFPSIGADRLLVPPAWTLAVELMFYLLAPFLARRSSFFLFILALVLLPFRGNLHFWGSQLPLFLVGMLIYRAKIIPQYRSALDSWIGDLSFPVYLIHYPVIQAFNYSHPVAALAVTAVLAVALKLAMHPIEKARDAIRVHHRAAPRGEISEISPRAR